ncbi:MAG TPA: hypothetical protein VMT60_04295, partial [Candidatus Bathyarchaeia archaeon]|nr:hypothetical protein [Candidatus Bathyarchaeia archaeon]
PTDPRIWDPMTARHRVVRIAVDCVPCRKRTCVENSCLSAISPDMVLKEIEEVLAADSGAGSGAGKGRCA